MLSCNFVYLVIVAVVTGVLDIIRSMAGIALELRTSVFQAMVEWKGMLLQSCRAPRLGCMTGSALQPEYARVDFWLFVAIRTQRGCISINLVYMAVSALQGSVFSFQREKFCMDEIM